jgi:hypothetical protein
LATNRDETESHLDEADRLKRADDYRTCRSGSNAESDASPTRLRWAARRGAGLVLASVENHGDDSTSLFTRHHHARVCAMADDPGQIPEMRPSPDGGTNEHPVLYSSFFSAVQGGSQEAAGSPDHLRQWPSPGQQLPADGR